MRHADSEHAPRNRFMAWLESMRIVEEVPKTSTAKNTTTTRLTTMMRTMRHIMRQGAHAKYPVPQGRQRRGETEQLDNPRPSSNHRASERTQMTMWHTRNIAHGTKSVRRKSDEDETYEEDRRSVKSARCKLDDDEAYEEDHRVLKPARRKVR